MSTTLMETNVTSRNGLQLLDDMNEGLQEMGEPTYHDIASALHAIGGAVITALTITLPGRIAKALSVLGGFIGLSGAFNTVKSFFGNDGYDPFSRSVDAVSDLGQTYGHNNVVLVITTKSYRESLPSHTNYYTVSSYKVAYQDNGITKYLYF